MKSLNRLIKTYEEQLDTLKALTVDRYIIFYELSKLRQNAVYDRKQLYTEYSILAVDAAFRDILKNINDYMERIGLTLAARSEYGTIVKAKTLFAPQAVPNFVVHSGNTPCGVIRFKCSSEWNNNFTITGVQAVELKSFSLHLSSEEGIARDFYIVYSINKKDEIKFGYSIRSDKDEANLKLAETIAIGRHNKSEKIATLVVSDSFKDRTKFMVKQIVISAVNAIFYDLVNRLVNKENKKGIIK